ncbi:1-phosphofructokinase family hexose kinase [Fontivita pretiosa]|uniref:1-phosphofructokinase family hexose kinase n=1 Tax=Fontivita pretiosa TaxID=2989684 RepID=UPI003D181B75
MIICLGTTPTMQRTMSFPRLTIDAVNRATAVHDYASGKVTNVARVLHTLGQSELLLTGFLGGIRGRTFRADLDAAGVPHDFVEVSALTRLCITVIDQSARTATELVEEPKPVAPQDYQKLLDKLRGLLAGARLLVLSGTLPPGADPDFYARCVELASRHGVRVILDAVGQPLLRALPHRPHIVKPNQSELSRTLERDLPDEKAVGEAMRELIARGAEWVVTTRGPKDTLLTNGESFWRVTTPKVQVVSAIGSGDAFAAGLAFALSSGQELPLAAILGTACAAANAMTAFAGHVDRDVVQSLKDQIRLEQLA